MANLSFLYVLLAISLVPAISGCATQRSVVSFPDGIRVFTFTHDYANSHLVVKDGNAYLVDTGIEKSGPELAEDLRNAGFPPENIKAIVLTHGHADHAGGAAYLKKNFGTPVIAGQGDSGMTASGGLTDPLCPTSLMARIRAKSDQAARYTPLQPDQWVQKELNLEPLTGVPGRAVSMPGHTAGSLVVVLPQAALVGDLFRGSIIGNSAEIHFYMCDLESNRLDIGRLLNELAPSASQFFTGHFGPLSKESVMRRFEIQ
ncbi:MBL fold metallo-hydrolase [bacterium]|nr:MBL fold metallo-hydrolase [bacterium]